MRTPFFFKELLLHNHHHTFFLFEKSYPPKGFAGGGISGSSPHLNFAKSCRRVRITKKMNLRFISLNTEKASVSGTQSCSACALLFLLNNGVVAKKRMRQIAMFNRVHETLFGGTFHTIYLVYNHTIHINDTTD